MGVGADRNKSDLRLISVLLDLTELVNWNLVGMGGGRHNQTKNLNEHLFCAKLKVSS